MTRIINEKSGQCILPEIDMQSMPPSQVGVETIRWTVVNLKNSLSQYGPFEFSLADNDRSHINLKRSWISWSFRILGEDGLPYKKAGANGPTPIVGPVQNLAESFTKQCTLILNGVVAESNSVNSAYRQNILNSLSMSSEAMKNNLSVGGFYEDSKLDDETSPGHINRAKMCEDGVITTVTGPLPLNLASQDRCLPNMIKVDLVVFANNSKFLLNQFAGAIQNLKLEIVDVHINLAVYDLHEGASTAIERYLMSNGKIHYPMNSIEMRSFFISEGRRDSGSLVAYNRIPKRITLAMVNSARLNGQEDLDPFRYQHFNLTNIYIEAGSTIIPHRPWNLNYATNSYTQAYMGLLEATGHARNPISQALSFDYKKAADGWCIYCFDISPAANEPGIFSLIQSGNLTVRCEFADVIPRGGIYLLCLAEFSDIQSMSKDRTWFSSNALE